MNKLVQTIGIVGAGAIGMAMGGVLSKAGLRVEYWDQDIKKCTSKSIGDLATHAELIMLCVPSWVNEKLTTQLAQLLGANSNKLVLSVAKGAAAGFVPVADILEQASQGHFDTGVLHGPMLAQEVMAGKYGSAILATKSQSWFNCLKMDNTKFYIEYSSDPHSVALAGALKNIYAIALGVNDGLELGANAKGRLATMAVAEMKGLMKELHGDPEVVESLAGLGDLLATGWSEQSFNHRIGSALAQGNLKESEATGEGVHSLQELAKTTSLDQFPVASHTQKLMTGGIKPSEWSKFLG